MLEATHCLRAKAGRGTGLCLSLPSTVHAFDPLMGERCTGYGAHVFVRADVL